MYVCMHVCMCVCVCERLVRGDRKMALAEEAKKAIYIYT